MTTLTRLAHQALAALCRIDGHNVASLSGACMRCGHQHFPHPLKGTR